MALPSWSFQRYLLLTSIPNPIAYQDASFWVYSDLSLALLQAQSYTENGYTNTYIFDLHDGAVVYPSMGGTPQLPQPPFTAWTVGSNDPNIPILAQYLWMAKANTPIPDPYNSSSPAYAGVIQTYDYFLNAKADADKVMAQGNSLYTLRILNLVTMTFCYPSLPTPTNYYRSWIAGFLIQPEQNLLSRKAVNAVQSSIQSSGQRKNSEDIIWNREKGFYPVGP